MPPAARRGPPASARAPSPAGRDCAAALATSSAEQADRFRRKAATGSRLLPAGFRLMPGQPLARDRKRIRSRTDLPPEAARLIYWQHVSKWFPIERLRHLHERLRVSPDCCIRKSKEARVSVSVPDDGKACAQLGFAAVQRYFESGAMARNRDYEAAEHHLGTALDLLAPDDALRADVSFALGAIRVADHETRCARPCPAPAEIAPIVALLAPACAAEGAPSERLYPYAMAVDKLYEHTHDPADIDRAIAWLRKAAGLPGLPAGDRRRAQISLAAQHANRGDSL